MAVANYAGASELKGFILSIVRRWSSPGIEFVASEPEVWFGPAVKDLRTKPACGGVPERLLLGEKQAPGLVARRLEVFGYTPNSQAEIERFVGMLLSEQRIERVTGDSTAYESRNGRKLNGPVYRVSWGWLPVCARETIDWIQQRRVEGPSRYLPRHFAKEMFRRISMVMGECAGLRETTLPLPATAQEGYTALSTILPRMGRIDCSHGSSRAADGVIPHISDNELQPVNASDMEEIVGALRLIADAERTEPHLIREPHLDRGEPAFAQVHSERRHVDPATGEAGLGAHANGRALAGNANASGESRAPVSLTAENDELLGPTEAGNFYAGLTGTKPDRANADKHLRDADGRFRASFIARKAYAVIQRRPKRVRDELLQPDAGPLICKHCNQRTNQLFQPDDRCRTCLLKYHNIRDT